MAMASLYILILSIMARSPFRYNPKSVRLHKKNSLSQYIEIPADSVKVFVIISMTGHWNGTSKVCFCLRRGDLFSPWGRPERFSVPFNYILASRLFPFVIAPLLPRTAWGICAFLYTSRCKEASEGQVDIVVVSRNCGYSYHRRAHYNNIRDRQKAKVFPALNHPFVVTCPGPMEPHTTAAKR